GKIIEMCSGQRWFEYVSDHILGPLGMRRTCFYAEQLARAENAAMPYEMTADGRRLPAVYAFSDINCKGGLISSVTELAQYVSMYQAKGALPGGGSIISPASYAEMTTPRVNTPPKEGYFGDSFYGYGLGINHNFLGRTLIGHGGSVRVSTAYMGFLPQDGLGAVVLANGSGYSPQFIAMYLLAAALGEDPDDLPFVKTESLLKSLSGNYKTYQGTMRAQVRKAGDMLVFTLEDKHAPATLPLLPHRLDGDPLIFYTLTGGAKIYVEFSRTAEHTTLLYERYAFRKY
ncbi:MAG: serine hydrolase, partial [Anaerolineaceae bacterium]